MRIFLSPKRGKNHLFILQLSFLALFPGRKVLKNALGSTSKVCQPSECEFALPGHVYNASRRENTREKLEFMRILVTALRNRVRLPPNSCEALGRHNSSTSWSPIRYKWWNKYFRPLSTRFEPIYFPIRTRHACHMTSAGTGRELPYRVHRLRFFSLEAVPTRRKKTS